jgi:hypothetical protein
VQLDLGDMRVQVEAKDLPKSALIIDLAQGPAKEEPATKTSTASNN